MSREFMHHYIIFHNRIEAPIDWNCIVIIEKEREGKWGRQGSWFYLGIDVLLRKRI